MASPVELVTLTEAKRHLRVTTTDEDASIELYIQIASDAVLNYLKYPDESLDWDSTTVPLGVKGAVLMQIAEFWAKRGDEGDATYAANANNRVADGYLTPNVTRLLHRYRDLTLR